MIGVLPESENNVLSFLPEIANRLNLQELSQKTKYLNNPCFCRYLQKLRTLGSLSFLSAVNVASSRDETALKIAIGTNDGTMAELLRKAGAR